MSLPVGAPTVVCTLSKPLLAEGTVGSIASASLKMDRDLVWVASRETIYKEAVPVPVIKDTNVAGTLTFRVIPVDVDGMQDVAGNEVKNWTYTLRVTLNLASGVSRTVDYVFQPLQSNVSVDLDLIPQLGAAPIPPISSVGIVDGGAP